MKGAVDGGGGLIHLVFRPCRPLLWRVCDRPTLTFPPPALCLMLSVEPTLLLASTFIFWSNILFSPPPVDVRVRKIKIIHFGGFHDLDRRCDIEVDYLFPFAHETRTTRNHSHRLCVSRYSATPPSTSRSTPASSTPPRTDSIACKNLRISWQVLINLAAT